MAQLNITLNQDEILQLLSSNREDAFKSLLNNQRCSLEYVDIIYSPEEIAQAQSLSEKSKSAVENARAFFKTRIHDLTSMGKSIGLCNCTVTPTLKREAKKRGYVYKGTGGSGWFEATKKNAKRK